MLYIIYKENGKEKSVSWHVGERINNVFLSDNTREVVRVQADCDELTYIIHNFNSLPLPTHRRVVVWYGDLAKLIAHNL